MYENKQSNMKEVVMTGRIPTIDVNDIEKYNTCIGVLDQNGNRFITAQVDYGVCILLGVDDQWGLNRRNDTKHSSIRQLVNQSLKDGCKVYMFDNSIEAIKWLIN